MAEELTRSLTMLAERGVPRGAAEVLEAARNEATERRTPQPATWQHGLLVAMGTATVVVVLIGVVALFVRPLGEGDVGPTVTEPPVAGTEAIPDGESRHPLNDVEALAFAPDGRLWAATAGGVVRWDLTAGVPTVFGDADGVPSSDAMAVDVGPDGTVWAAGDGWIGRYDGSWEVFSSQNEPLIDSQITSMAVDDDGVVWVGVASEPYLRYDGAWTQGALPPAGVWSDDSGDVVAGDGTRWTASESGITGLDGMKTTTLVVPPAIATRRQAPITLTPMPAEQTLRISTAIGDLEFTTMRLPVGHSFFFTEATPHGPVATEGFDILRWSTDGVTWEGVLPTIDPWRITIAGGDVILHEDGYARYAWDGTAWTEASIVDLPGPARHLALGPRGSVAVIDDVDDTAYYGTNMYYATEGADFAQAEAGPNPELLTAGSRACVQNGPSGYSDPPQSEIGPVLATEAGFVLLTPAHPDNWSQLPACEPLLWFSPDGNRWDLVSSQSPFGEGAIVHRIAEHAGRYVAVGATPSNTAEGAVWTSDDALTWQRADVEMDAAVGVAGGDLGWMVTGHATESMSELAGVDMWFSTDGLTWDGPHQGPDALGTLYFLPELAVGTDTIYGVGGTHDTYVIGRVHD